MSDVLQATKLYIAGAMAGYADFNHPAFYSAEEWLRSKGLDAVNPAALDEVSLPEGVESNEDGTVTNSDRAKFLHRDFIELLGCDGILLLDGWEDSVGANCELMVMRVLNMPVYVIDDWALSLTWAMPNMKMVNKYVMDLYWRTGG